MSWEDQGRQYHMWFGHGTAPAKVKGAAPDPSISSMGIGERAAAVAYGAVAALPTSLRRRAEAQYQHGTLARLNEAMTTWISATRLDQGTFAMRLFGRTADDPVVRDLNAAALSAATATSHLDFRHAAEKVADAIQAVGVDRRPRFVSDAAGRARDPATQAAIETSTRPPSLARETIRPVYPVETAIGVIAAGALGGVGAAARAAGGAILRQLVPESRLPAGESAVPKPFVTLPAGKSTKPLPSSSGVRLQEGLQGKHIQGSKNFDPTRSTLTANPQKLLNRFAGRGEKRGHVPVGQPGSKEAFDTGKEVIGINRSRSGVSAPTTRGMIHYSKRGAHIVPAAPAK